MYLFNQRLAAEWQALDVAYPEWLTRIVLDEVYYITTMTLVCATSFAVGMIIGIVWCMV